MSAIEHQVFFTLKHPAGSLAERDFLRASRDILSAIPEVEAFQVLRQVSAKSEFRFGFSMRFRDRAAYDAYSAHPTHEKYVSERWASEVQHFQEIDTVAEVLAE